MGAEPGRAAWREARPCVAWPTRASRHPQHQHIPGLRGHGHQRVRSRRVTHGKASRHDPGAPGWPSAAAGHTSGAHHDGRPAAVSRSRSHPAAASVPSELFDSITAWVMSNAVACSRRRRTRASWHGIALRHAARSRQLDDTDGGGAGAFPLLAGARTCCAPGVGSSTSRPARRPSVRTGSYVNCSWGTEQLQGDAPAPAGSRRAHNHDKHLNAPFALEQFGAEQRLDQRHQRARRGALVVRPPRQADQRSRESITAIRRPRPSKSARSSFRVCVLVWRRDFAVLVRRPSRREAWVGACC